MLPFLENVGCVFHNAVNIPSAIARTSGSVRAGLLSTLKCIFHVISSGNTCAAEGLEVSQLLEIFCVSGVIG